MDLRNSPAEVRPLIGDQRHFNVDGRCSGLIRDLQLQAFEQGPKLALRKIGQPVGKHRQMIERLAQVVGRGRSLSFLVGEDGRAVPAILQRAFEIGDATGLPAGAPRHRPTSPQPSRPAAACRRLRRSPRIASLRGGAQRPLALRPLGMAGVPGSGS